MKQSENWSKTCNNVFGAANAADFVIRQGASGREIGVYKAVNENFEDGRNAARGQKIKFARPKMIDG
jgi:hypothetical protein